MHGLFSTYVDYGGCTSEAMPPPSPTKIKRTEEANKEKKKGEIKEG